MSTRPNAAPCGAVGKTKVSRYSFVTRPRLARAVWPAGVGELHRMNFATLNAEPAGDEVRVETHRGRQHVVAPVVMVREGVLNGGYLPFDAIAESIPGWNGRPVTAPPSMNESGHPVDEDGNFVSANEADFLESMRVGFLQAPEATEDLPATNDESAMSPKGARAEVWVDLEAAEAVGEAAIEAVRAMVEGEPLEVSTGYFHKRVDRGGSFNGERYDHEQFGLMPDHLALLPNEKGACSWQDGCGAPRVHQRMNTTVNQTEGDRVRWDADGQPRYGIIVDDQEGESADEVLVAVYAFDGDEWVRGDDTVNLAEDTFEVIEQFPTEPANDDEPADNVAAMAAGATESTLSERATHAVHILTGQSSSCTCGGHGDDGPTETQTESNTNMSDHDYEALAEALGIATDTLEAMSDDEVENLKSNMESSEDGGDDETDATAHNTDDDAQNDEVTALREQVETLTETVENLEAQQNADPEAEEARQFLADNTDRDAESLGDWPDEAVLETARAHGFGTNYAAPRGDRVNRLGQAGSPAAQSESEDAEEYVASAGAFNQLAADEGGD